MIAEAFRKKRYRVKCYVRVGARYWRDERGRFAGGLERSGYSYRVYDRTVPMVTGSQLMAENILANNELLRRLRQRGSVKS